MSVAPSLPPGWTLDRLKTLDPQAQSPSYGGKFPTRQKAGEADLLAFLELQPSTGGWTAEYMVDQTWIAVTAGYHKAVGRGHVGPNGEPTKDWDDYKKQLLPFIEQVRALDVAANAPGLASSSAVGPSGFGAAHWLRFGELMGRVRAAEGLPHSFDAVPEFDDAFWAALALVAERTSEAMRTLPVAAGALTTVRGRTQHSPGRDLALKLAPVWSAWTGKKATVSRGVPNLPSGPFVIFCQTAIKLLPEDCRASLRLGPEAVAEAVRLIGKKPDVGA